MKEIRNQFNLYGSDKSYINTSIPFFDHVLEALSRHGFFDINLEIKNKTDEIHIAQIAGEKLGEALSNALGQRCGIKRYGWSILPMDETLIMVSLDLSGRPYLVYDVNFNNNKVGKVSINMFNIFFRAFVNKAGMNLHINLIRGKENHHIIECIFKTLAKALDQATTKEERLSIDSALTTKGGLYR